MMALYEFLNPGAVGENVKFWLSGKEDTRILLIKKTPHIVLPRKSSTSVLANVPLSVLDLVENFALLSISFNNRSLRLFVVCF